MSTRPTTTTPRTRTQPSARPDPGGLWILPVVWKTRAIRSASTEPPLESAFPTPPWTPHAAPTGTTGILIDAHLHEITVG
jgi:hypothetical protein